VERTRDLADLVTLVHADLRDTRARPDPADGTKRSVLARRCGSTFRAADGDVDAG
jgi:hypothetical protein